MRLTTSSEHSKELTRGVSEPSTMPVSVLRGNNATLTLDVYPEGAQARSQFTLYEDDGTSNAYLTDGFATTTITCDVEPGGQVIELRVAPIEGDYEGKLVERQWKLQLHLNSKPTRLSLNNGPVAWSYDPNARIVRAEWHSPTAEASDVEIHR